MEKFTHDEVLLQVKRLYTLHELSLSESNSEVQDREARFTFTRFMNNLSERFNSPLVDYIFWEDNTVESCTEKVMKNLEKLEDDN